MRSTSLRAIVGVVIVVFAAGAGAQAPAPPPLPKQDIVFVIDNSGSMELPPTASDPLRLRGIAAGLILDAVEISSDVRAGLIFFGDDVSTDGQLHQDTTQVRLRLGPARLPEADGSTNMLDALNRAVAMFGRSTADRKRIVLITDGAPNPGQASIILNTTAAATKAAGIEIFALGLSTNVDQKFLDELTKKSGGRTLLAAQHHQLLDLAKQLVSDRDNVYTLDKTTLPSGTMEYAFTLRTGTDRARITAMLDQPTAFAPDELEFRLEGPGPGDIRPYEIRPQQGTRIVAWTAFVSQLGDYKLRVNVKQPGASGHRGMRIVLEALSDVHAQLRLTPDATVRVFGDEVRVDVEAATSTGTSNAAALKIIGSVRTPNGGSTAIAFSGPQGTFEVPAVAGRHAVVVRVETSLSQVEVRAEYDAYPQVPPVLKTSRNVLKFVRPLSPADPQIEESFKLYAEFAGGARPIPVKFSFIVISPVGIVEMLDGGTVMKPGTTEYPIPSGGLDLTLRIRMDPKTRLPKKGGKFESELQIASGQAPSLKIPFVFDFRVPKFEVDEARNAFTLWWDPHRSRDVHLGALQSDLAANSTFHIILPETINAPDQGPKIADLALRIPANDVEPEHIEGAKLRYGPLELEAGEDFPIELMVTPTAVTGWERLPSRPRPIEIQIISDLGMETEIVPVFWNVGGAVYEIPLLGRWSRHGRHWATVLFLLVAFVLLALMALRRIRWVRSFWPYRPGSYLPLGFGSIQIGDVTANAGAALVLPNTESHLDNTTVGHVYIGDRQRQRVEDASGQMTPTRAVLGPGDPLVIMNPQDTTGQETLWEFEYIDFDPIDGGEVVVTKSPAPWTIKRFLRWAAVSVGIIGVLLWFVSSPFAAGAAYSVLGFVEAIYLYVLQP